MRVVKNIHNNISLCLDSKGNEVVAFGKGIGFRKPPYEISIGQVERTFYNINTAFVDTLSQIPEDIIEVSANIIDYANHISNQKYNDNLIFTLADHIMFSIKRLKKNISINLPFVHEVKHIYPKEIQIGEYAIKVIKEKLHIQLPQQEIAVITLHVVDYGLSNNAFSESGSQSKIDKCTDIVEECIGLKIDKEGFSYSRFVSHMYYLFDRVANNTNVITQNSKMFDRLIEEYPKTYECVIKICEALNLKLNDEELIYLILHINRLSSREELV